MAVETREQGLLSMLADKATRLRIDSIRATTAAGSGHPTSCASAAEIMSVLFFSVMRYDPKDPANPNKDTFILSKGHAAPILYAAWAEAGAFPREHLLELRKFGSDLEGHPTPRLPFVDVATGSLGQGLSAGVGMALNAKYLDKSDQRIYVLMGDGESVEGSVWEAAHVAAHYQLNNLCATIDVNRLGQSEPTMDQHHMSDYRAKWSAFGWNARIVDGHDIAELLDAYEEAARNTDRPTIILARTLKGKGIPSTEDKEGQHGKALKPDVAEQTVRLLEQQLSGNGDSWHPSPLPGRAKSARNGAGGALANFPKPPYALNSGVATRQACGAALAEVGKLDSRVVVLDGDVKNSTHTEDFQKACPDRFFQMYIAEQNMVGAAMGFAAKGKIPFASTFACFFTRAADFIRMAAISQSNIKLIGTHAGISIGEDGPSQMGLEDLAFMCAEPDATVLYPSDGVSAWHAARLVAGVKGLSYIRTGRPKSPVVYGQDEVFEIGKCKVLRSSPQDRVTVVAAGVTLAEALNAHEQLQREGIAIRVIDLFSVQPIDREALRKAARETGGRMVTVEDHYAHGGLGDAVLAAVAEDGVKIRKLAVRDIPRSGTPEELPVRFGISSKQIQSEVKALLGA